MDERRTPYAQIIVLLAAFGLLLAVLIGGRQKRVGLIAFVSSRDGSNELYVMNSDGSNQRQLTCNQDIYSGPIWRPDGTRIAFVSWRDQGDFEIYLLNISETLQNPLPSENTLENCEDTTVRLTRNNGEDLRLAWSPNSQKIVFVSYRENRRNIYVMNWDGSDQRALTDMDSADYSPVWSPDGQYIAFESGRDGNLEIYVMRSDGDNPRRLTDNDVRDFQPMWSPDGQYILFDVRGRSDGRTGLYIMDANGGNRRHLSRRYGSGYWADNHNSLWSPDGRYVVFDERRGRHLGIYVMEVATGNHLQITQHRAEDTDPTWSPDGRQIAFVSDRDDNWEIYIMDANGRNVRRLTWNEAIDASPAWQP